MEFDIKGTNYRCSDDIMEDCSMKKIQCGIIFILIMIISASVISQAAVFDKEQKNILVLNSYHPGLEWTDEANVSIAEYFNQFPGEIYTYVEYMDWKNNPNQENIEFLYQRYNQKYKDKKIDAIITTDDTALEFAIEYREEIFSNAPIIFTGVSQVNAELKLNKNENIIGIFEKADIDNTLKLIKQLDPSVKNIYTVHDQTESGISIVNEIEKAIKGFDPSISIVKNQEKTLEDIIKKIDRLPENSAVIISIFFNDINNSLMGFSANTKHIIETAKPVPIYVLYDFNFGFGAIGGSMIRSKAQGEKAAELAYQITHGNNEILKEKSIVIESKNKSVDYNAITKAKLDVLLVPKEYTIINKPENIFNKFGGYVYSAFAILALLLIFIAILMTYIKKLVFLKNSLNEKNTEQKKLFDDLEKSEEELNIKYKELNDTYKELNQIQEQLNLMAYNDQLTGLGNRAGLFKYLNIILKMNKLNHGAILMVDIDNFKRINDTMGHFFGDMLIKRVGKRFREILDDNYTVFRIGGDEFVITLNNCNKNESKVIADLILESFANNPMIIEENTVSITLSLGIALYPTDAITINDLLICSDIAMYQSKEKGRNRVTFFSNEMLEKMSRRRDIERNLENAMQNNEFTVHFQPQIDMNTDEVWGFEALIRWNNQELGYVPPIDFIDIAEEKKMIISIGEFVLSEACAFIKRINKKYSKEFKISVNASPVEIVQENFNKKIAKTLDEFELDYSYLEIEITESVVVEAFEIVHDKLLTLKAMGIKIALDDFGTGYSSLSYIQKLPITTLKIDKAFTDEVNKDLVIADLVKEIINIGKLLKLEVVTEGVEEKEQMEFLKRNGTNRIQGYYYSKPMPEDVLIPYLHEKGWI